MKIFDNTMTLLQKVLDIRVENQQAIAANIANANTPGYAPAHLEFEGRLQQAVSNTAAKAAAPHPAHFPIGAAVALETVQPQVLRSRPRAKIGDGNEVKVDQEMIQLSENQILYEAATQMLNKKLGLLKYVAQDGK